MRYANAMRTTALAFALVFSIGLKLGAQPGDPLPSWNEGAAKRAILDFVKCATNKDCPEFIPPAERIATFDNDGTLWSEQPIYFQFAFAIDRVKAEAACKVASARDAATSAPDRKRGAVLIETPVEDYRWPYSAA